MIFGSWRRVPGDQCVGDLPSKLYKLEDCQIPTPAGTPDKPDHNQMKLELLNKTKAAVIGEGLQFAVSEVVSP